MVIIRVTINSGNFYKILLLISENLVLKLPKPPNNFGMQ